MRKLIISLSAAFAILAPLAAQDLETGYFLGGNPYAFRLNPAFQSERNILSIGLGMTGLSAISNLGFSTMLYPEGGKLYTCLNDHVSASELLGKLHRNNYMDLGARVNLLTVGFWSRRNFFTIDINVRNQEGVSLPYDLFRFIKGRKALSLNVRPSASVPKLSPRRLSGGPVVSTIISVSAFAANSSLAPWVRI